MSSITFSSITIEKFPQSAFRIESAGKHTYIDPFRIPDGSPKADAILITHSHGDHLELESIEKIATDKTEFVASGDVALQLQELGYENTSAAIPGSSGRILNTPYRAFPAYNTEKSFHPRQNYWIGYQLEFPQLRVVHLGDSDPISEYDELEKQMDVLMVPISGHYVMNPMQAVEVINILEPKKIIPMHHDAGIIGNLEQVEVLVKEFGDRVVDLSIKS